MIRIGLPPPTLPRLRVRWDVARASFARHTSAFLAFANRQTESAHHWWRHTALRLPAPLSFRARAQARQRDLLDRFDEPFQELSDLICVAARVAETNAPQEQRYAELRIILRLQYRVLRPTLQPYWRTLETPSAQDPFETLFFPDSLDKVIFSEGGFEAISEARGALDSYRDTLESRMRLR